MKNLDINISLQVIVPATESISLYVTEDEWNEFIETYNITKDTSNRKIMDLIQEHFASLKYSIDFESFDDDLEYLDEYNIHNSVIEIYDSSTGESVKPEFN